MELLEWVEINTECVPTVRFEVNAGFTGFDFSGGVVTALMRAETHTETKEGTLKGPVSAVNSFACHSEWRRSDFLERRAGKCLLTAMSGWGG